MKKIKVKYCPFNGTTEKDSGTYNFFIHNILKKYYDVEVSENPDYIFFHESSYDHLQYKGVKIFYTGENIYPNFNFCDYAIGFDYLNYSDRYYRLPIYLVSLFYREKELEKSQGVDFTKSLYLKKEDLESKTDFCSFVYSNYLADPAREIFFKKLSTYKKVNSGGKYLNNIGGPTQDKLGFELKHKFSIAFENSIGSGYTTEKLVNAFIAKTIPIYWGNPLVGEEFNTKRFINCHDFKDFDEVIEYIKKIDADDNLYLEIINQPVLSGKTTPEEILSGFELFLKKIFDQDVVCAKRININPARQLEMIKNEKIIWRYKRVKNYIMRILSKTYSPFKKIPGIEKMKQFIFSKI